MLQLPAIWLVFTSNVVRNYRKKYKMQQGKILKSKDTWFSVPLHEALDTQNLTHPYLGMKPTSDGHSQKIPVEHLDYDYISNCKDAKYLEKILTVLRYRQPKYILLYCYLLFN